MVVIRLLILLAILAAGYVLLAWTAWKMDIRQPAPRDSDVPDFV